MKKYLIALLAAGIITGMVACGTDPKQESDSGNTQVTEESVLDENAQGESAQDESAQDESDSTISQTEPFTITIGEGEEGAFIG